VKLRVAKKLLDGRFRRHGDHQRAFDRMAKAGMFCPYLVRYGAPRDLCRIIRGRHLHIRSRVNGKQPPRMMGYVRPG